MLYKFFLTIAVVLLVLGQGTEAVPQAYRTPCDSVSQLTPPIFTYVGLPQRRDLLQTPDVSVPHWHRLISKDGFGVEEADIGVAFTYQNGEQMPDLRCLSARILFLRRKRMTAKISQISVSHSPSSNPDKNRSGLAAANWTIHIRNKFIVDWRGIKMRWGHAMHFAKEGRINVGRRITEHRKFLTRPQSPVCPVAARFVPDRVCLEDNNLWGLQRTQKVEALLVWRIWRVEHQNAMFRGTTASFTPVQQPRLHKVIRVVAESDLAYTTLLLMTFVLSLCSSNALYPLSDVTLQATDITFNVIIIRSTPRDEQFSTFDNTERGTVPHAEGPPSRRAFSRLQFVSHPAAAQITVKSMTDRPEDGDNWCPEMYSIKDVGAV
ncbi:hypothetical protein B0H14DRAFT_3555266 [Mycena olivaceomarginata]|nr:hypothetical protein B0H14DRAFT_3555266 [Mycena olivaceomarginata]